MQGLLETHHWLTPRALEDIDVSGADNSVIGSDFPASEREKHEKLTTIRDAYIVYAYAQAGLTHRGDPPERRFHRTKDDSSLECLVTRHWRDGGPI